MRSLAEICTFLSMYVDYSARYVCSILQTRATLIEMLHLNFPPQPDTTISNILGKEKN